MKQAGFSIIEMMIGITVLISVAAIGIPSFKSSVGNGQIRTVAESIKNGLQIARIEAIKRNSKVVFTLNNNTFWQIGCQNVTSDCPALIQSKPASEGSSSNISLVINTGNNVIFNSFGLRDINSTIAQIDISNTTLATSERRPLRVLVSSGGSAKVCDPKITIAGDPRRC